MSTGIPKQKQAEEALRESEECFRNLIEGSIQGILIDRDRKPVFVNQAYVDMLGYVSADEILALASTDPCVASHERARLKRYTKSRLKGEPAPSQYEYDAVRKDGSIVTLQNVVRCVTWKGQPAIQNTVIDITERKRAEETLRRYKHIVSANSAFISFIDKGYIYREVNASYLKAFGKTKEQIVGAHMAEVLGEEAFKTAKPNVDRCLAGEHVNYQFWLEFPQWGRRYLDVHYDPFRETDGSISGVVIDVRDITDTKRAADALENLSRQNESIVTAAGEGIYGLDVNGNTTFINPAAARMVGWDVGELVGKSQHAVLHHSRPDGSPYAQAECPIYATFKHGQACNVSDEVFWRKDGTSFPVEYTSTPIRDEQGQLAGAVVVFQDITERQQVAQALRESETRFRDLIEGSIQGILIHRDWKPLFVNQAYADILGYASPEEILAMKSIEPQVAPHERLRRRRYMEARLRGEEAPSQYEVDAVCKDGSIVTLYNSTRLISWQGQPAIQSTVIDITERKRAEETLRASEERYRVLYEENPSMFLTVDPKGTVLSVNPFGAQQLGYSAEELVGMSVFALFHEEHRETAKQNLDDVMHDPGRLHRWEVVKVRKDGCLLWMRETARLTEDADGQPVMLIVCEDITEAHQLSEKLSYQASHDALTGLINRWEFERRLQRVLQTTRSDTTRHALCYLDLDQFKIINDLCGHVAGDELLRQLGRVLAKQVRQGDTLARLGGDEFGVLLEHCSLAQAKRLASTLKQTIEEFRFIWEGRSFSLGVSIGLVPLDEASDTITGVLRAADAACYAAKDEGRNRIHLYQEDDAELSRRHGEMQWVAWINEALEQNRFHLAFQQIAALKNPEGEHYELLIRMEDEAGQIIAPGAFLPAAERYNLAPKLDRWVIDTALTWFATHPQQLERLYLCSINLSGQSLGDQDFLQFVIDKFGEGQVPPEKICFEITETATIANLSSATDFIAALKKLGCYFALDDFGSGLSSFAYLKNLAVDFLKIDGMFVKDIIDDPTDLAVVISINEIGRAMGKKTIAEFVENEAILEKLREIGVDYAQGYGIGRPMPLTEMLNKHKRVARTAG